MSTSAVPRESAGLTTIAATGDAASRLHRTRVLVRRGLYARALALGIASGAVVVALGTIIARMLAPVADRISLLPWLLGLVVGSIIAAIAIRSVSARTSLAQLALWLEERVPALGWALASAAESITEGRAPSLMLERAISDVPFEPVVQRAVRRSIRAPLLFAAGGLLLATAAHIVPMSVGAAIGPRQGAAAGVAVATGGENGALAGTSSFADFDVTVTPPAYARQPTRSERAPSEMRALAGSSVRLSGVQGSQPVALTLDGSEGATTAAAAEQRGTRWETRLTMPPRTVVARLTAGAETRLLLLTLVPDSAPVVTLLMPARDSVLRTGAGTIALRASSTDDIGLQGAAFEYIVSSGQGESFTFRTGTVGARTFAGARAGELTASLPLAPLALVAGDIIHLRAIASDGNTVTGPGRGASGTRTLRIARAGEYDSLSIEAAPPAEADKSMISQRMLIMLTEALVKSSARIGPPATLRESQRIGDEQRALRKQVGDIVFARAGGEASAEHSHAGEAPEAHAGEEQSSGGTLTDTLARRRDSVLGAASAATGGAGPEEALDFHGDETPVVAVNRPLLEAYNHMWDAGRELEGGRPAEALPPMRLALAAIQRARSAERLYLRGRPPAVVVDVDRVRLQGTGLPADVAARQAVASPESELAARRAARFAGAMSRLRAEPAAAADSLLMLRASVLADGTVAAPLAQALADALDDLRAGRDATEALVRVRRALAPALAGAARAPLGAWTGTW